MRTDMNLALLLLRLGAGALLLFGHGWTKLVHYAERVNDFANPIGIGSAPGFTLVVFAEVMCSVLVAIGLATRLATIPLLGFFAVAAFVQHAHDPWARKELPLLYGLAYLAILLAGPGRYSVDAWMRRKRGGT